MKEQELNKTEYLVQYWNDNTGNGVFGIAKANILRA
jgi:hypothetical protein